MKDSFASLNKLIVKISITYTRPVDNANKRFCSETAFCVHQKRDAKRYLHSRYNYSYISTCSTKYPQQQKISSNNLPYE